MILALFGLICLLASTTVVFAIDDNVNVNSKVKVNSNSNSNSNSNAIQNDLVSWVRSKGGSFSDKIEIRRVDPKDPTSYMGVFVREAIVAKESLFVIPRDCYIHVFDTAAAMDPEDEDAEDVYQDTLCELATKLMEEMKLGEESEYAPYIAYLKTQTPGQLPANWSPQGKELLRWVAIPGSPMVDWIDWNFKGEKHHCIGETKKQNNNNKNNNNESDISFEEHMVEMTIQRCFDTALIPIWDMVNHDNGRINTENDSMFEEDGLRLRAARNLKVGEEIFASYDKCLDCKGVEEYWGTPEILKDFGFVENYPHRWVFPEQDIWYEVYEDYEFDVYFGSDHENTPSEKQFEFLTKELGRLEGIGQSFPEDRGSMPEREWNTIVQFHDAAIIDMYAVVEWYNHAAKDDDLIAAEVHRDL
jgi:hypothetical protein